MPAQPPSSLDSKSLARRLGELACDERHLQVEFLLHLAELDRRRAWLELGYGSLWSYCLEALHLREGAAGRRIGAMKVLRRFPRLADALRDGRLCLTTLSQLGPVLGEENADDLVARAAYRTAAEVDHLVASMKPRPAPREGIRRLPELAASSPASASGSPARPEAAASPRLAPAGEADGEQEPQPHPAEAAPLALVDVPCPRTAEVRAVSEGQWSLRVTIGRALKEDLEALSMMLSHKVPKGGLAAVLHEAVRCGLETHGKRKGAVKTVRQVKRKANAPKNPAAIPAAVRRQVWERDGGRCTWTGPDGRRCSSRWQLEVDHVDPAARGAAATLDKVRLLCRQHNLLYAEQVYGPELMVRYRKGEIATLADSSRVRRGRRRSPPDRVSIVGDGGKPGLEASMEHRATAPVVDRGALASREGATSPLG